MRRIAETTSWFKGLFAMIFSAAVFLFMGTAWILQITDISTDTLWRLFWSAMLVSLMEYHILEQAVLPKVSQWIKLIGGYAVCLSVTLIFPRVFCFIYGTDSNQLIYTIILTVFFFGLQFGLHIFYRFTGFKMNQLLNQRKQKTITLRSK